MWPPLSYACAETLDNANGAETPPKLDLRVGIGTMDDC